MLSCLEVMLLFLLSMWVWEMSYKICLLSLDFLDCCCNTIIYHVWVSDNICMIRLYNMEVYLRYVSIYHKIGMKICAFIFHRMILYTWKICIIITRLAKFSQFYFLDLIRAAECVYAQVKCVVYDFPYNYVYRKIESQIVHVQAFCTALSKKT